LWIAKNTIRLKRNREAVVDEDRSDPAPGSGYCFDTVLQPKVTEILSFEWPFGKSNLPEKPEKSISPATPLTRRFGLK
jgi:hypothetical protein